ncbi:murein hydrolase activator EnvC family protein [Aureimonas glaciei]|uniref:Peptidase M23 n=1 Tax=Aureimonas glaciei TaxID=1776957 RepID=A0A917DID6_9HYPH|nr:peptidoglycan DD-metalloendopeptidase family protein [Aureimonas glaciei]GGD42950.1 peptidase M23 [Aureimonas glaciei]
MLAALVLAVSLGLGSTPVEAETADATETASISRVLILENERAKTAAELADLTSRISLTRENVTALDAEIAALAEDRTKIRTAMIEAAAAQKLIEKDIAATESRIDALAGDEASLKASLRKRRGLLAEVLGALERMGRKPPPALLVRPDDALGSVRSAILLGAVVPRIRKETDKLAADLDQLAAVKREIGVEKASYIAGMTRQKQEEARLARLFLEKQRLETDSRDRRLADAQRAAELAAKATSLQDLIASLDSEAESARAAEAAAAKLAEEKRQTAALQAAEAERLAAEREKAAQLAEQAPASPGEPSTVPDQAPPPVVAAVPPAETTPEAAPSYDVASLRREMTTIEPAAPFSTMKGRLTVPVSGHLQVGYGASDGIGRPSAGLAFATRAGDLVTAPADGRVLYSGPFRSYGQLLILDAGDGYHVVLAGMSKIDVAVGQFVLAGEPVAVMGARRVASTAASDFDASAPMLYVEFRKDGTPVDPAPWWSEEPSGRTRNDS